MRKLLNGLGAAAGIAILSACTSGQSGIEPPHTGANVQSTTSLQFRVGTALYPTGATYLNTLVTYRLANGLSGTLYNTPSIVGPANFLVPGASSAGTDKGTNHITGTPPTQPGTTAVATTFGQTGGAFAYGFAPANSTTTGAANYAQFSAVTGTAANNALYADDASSIVVGPGAGNTAGVIEPTAGNGGAFPYGPDTGSILNAYTQPFYISSANKLPFLMGPPAVPDFHNGTFPSGFLGYDSGFTIFGAAPVAGTYTLTVTVPSNVQGQNAAVLSSAGTLTSTTPLGAEATPVAITSTGDGGATFAVAPAPAGATAQVLYIVDVSAASGNPTFYTFNAGAAGGTFTLNASSGPKNAAGVASAPFHAGDTVAAYVVGADYDIVALAPPTNTSQTPALPAQADITVSQVYEGVYSTTAGPLARARSTR